MRFPFYFRNLYSNPSNLIEIFKKMSETEKKSQYWMGNDTLPIDIKGLCGNNRKRLMASIKKTISSDDKYNFSGHVIWLKGGEEQPIYCSDVDILFRQETFFHWAFGVTDPGFFGAIDLGSGKSFLFSPKLPEAYATWMGALMTNKQFKEYYSVADCLYDCEMVEFLKEKLEVKKLYFLNGRNVDSGLKTPLKIDEKYLKGLPNVEIDEKILHGVMVECRLIKSDEELRILRYTNKISSEAHCHVMKNIRVGRYEYEMESEFLHYCYSKGGMRFVSYTCICGTGTNGSILHYGHSGKPNSKLIKNNDMCLFDMGGEYYRYASDITTSFPANGKFTEKQKNIYLAVLEANRQVFKVAKPGMEWSKLHCLADAIQLRHLFRLGLVKKTKNHLPIKKTNEGECTTVDGLPYGSDPYEMDKENEEENSIISDMVKKRIGGIFMPHGLGHLMGLDVHDVGGYKNHNDEKRSTERGLKSLRLNRPLEKGMVLTIEPGIYFIEHLLKEAEMDEELKEYLNFDKINEYRSFGGIRIEDNVYINYNGNELLTKVPRTIDEIEEMMKREE
ncbi:hypothetical protein SNEBB_009618 [Seison nebaliae]|nr:hypothetical protein SNEBB_009618 [Seison nebaliae]